MGGFYYERFFFKYGYFKDINLEDEFFDTLKNDYAEFEDWFKRKGDKKAFYFEGEKGIEAFLYLKLEEEELIDVIPPQPIKKRVKVGTLKINPHGTKLGERFIKKAIDFAVVNDVKELYVTVFSKHEGLIALLKKYGFIKKAEKRSSNGTEEVMFKHLDSLSGDLLKDYPLVNIVDQNIYLLSIYPDYHTLMFPDSILHNESYDIIKDVSHTNSIQKIYICYMKQAEMAKPGDVIVIYRTNDGAGPAEYRSVATSICVVEEIKMRKDFAKYEDYYSYCKKHSVFKDDELQRLYHKKGFIILKLTYNLAMEKRLIRKNLIELCGIDRKAYPGFMPLNNTQFQKIIELGGIHESFIID